MSEIPSSHSCYECMTLPLDYTSLKQQVTQPAKLNHRLFSLLNEKSKQFDKLLNCFIRNSSAGMKDDLMRPSSNTCSSTKPRPIPAPRTSLSLRTITVEQDVLPASSAPLVSSGSSEPAISPLASKPDVSLTSDSNVSLERTQGPVTILCDSIPKYLTLVQDVD